MCAQNTIEMILMCLYCLHNWPYLLYNALNMSELERSFLFCYEVRTLRTWNNLYLSTSCCQQFKASGRLFLSSFWLLSHNVMMSQCFPLSHRGQSLSAKRDTYISIYISTWVSSLRFFSMCHCNNVQLCPFFVYSLKEFLQRIASCYIFKGAEGDIMKQQLALLSDSKKVRGSVSGLGVYVWVICSFSLCESAPGNLASLQFITIHIRLLQTIVICHLVGASDCGSVLYISDRSAKTWTNNNDTTNI